MKHPYSKHAHSKHAQRGAALIISMIFLLVMSLLGVAAIRGVAMEERMAGQSYDRSLAFQATEAALRAAELEIESLKPTASSGCAVVSGGTLMLCAPPLVTDTPRWLSTSFASWVSSATVGSGTTAVTPQFFAEYLGTGFPCDPADQIQINNLNCARYRVTARSRDNTAGRSSVMLQSVYATD